MTTNRRTAPPAQAALAAVIALAALAAWWAWLGPDPDSWSGPSWLGLGVTLVAVLVAVQLAGAHPVVSSVAVGAGFLVPVTWVLSRPTPGDFNFWPIAVGMLLTAAVLESTVVSMVVASLRRRRQVRRRTA